MSLGAQVRLIEMPILSFQDGLKYLSSQAMLNAASLGGQRENALILNNALAVRNAA